MKSLRVPCLRLAEEQTFASRCLVNSDVQFDRLGTAYLTGATANVVLALQQMISCNTFAPTIASSAYFSIRNPARNSAVRLELKSHERKFHSNIQLDFLIRISDMSFSRFDFKATSKVTAPAKLAHVVLFTNQIDVMEKFYVDFLGATVVHKEPKQISFIAYDDEHHRIALLNRPDLKDKDPQACGLHVSSNASARMRAHALASHEQRTC